MLKRGSLPSRTLAISLLGAIFVVGQQLVVAPLASIWSSATSRIEQANHLLDRYQKLAFERPILSKELSELRERAASVELAYVRGSSDALAAAELLNRTKSVIEDAGGEVSSGEVLAAEAVTTAPWCRRVAVSVRARVSPRNLAEGLYTLETGRPYVIVREINLSNELTGEAGLPVGDIVLEMMLEVFGYRLEESETQR